MKKIVIFLAFSAAMAAMTSCGKIENEPTPDRTINKLTTSMVTTAVTTTGGNTVTTDVKAESPKIKRLSFANEDETDEKSIPEPVVTAPAKDNTQTRTENKTSANNNTSGNSTGTSVTDYKGYSETVTTTAEAEDYYDDFSEIAGEWIYQKLNTSNQYINNGYVNIENDGFFEFYISESGKTKYGTVQRITEYDAGKLVTYFSFYENGTDLLTNSFSIPDEPDIRFVGYGETARMVKKEHLSEIIDFDIIAGEWEYQERERSSSEYKTVGKMTIDTNGEFSYCSNSGSDQKSGTISVRSENYADGKEKFYYAFYDNDDKDNIWKSCFCEQADPDIYYAGNGGDSRFVRADGSVFSSNFDMLAYKWDYQECRNTGNNGTDYVTVGYLTIDEDGHYTYISTDGKEERYGILRNDTDENGNEIIALYDYGQELWNYFKFDHFRCIFYDFCGGDTEARLFYHENDNTKGDHFIGLWSDDHSYVCCTRFLDGYEVIISRDFELGDHTYEHSGGEFYCLYDEKNDMLVCDGTAEYVCDKFKMDDTEGLVILEQSCDKSYSSNFRLENGNLIWEDTVAGKETVFNFVGKEED